MGEALAKWDIARPIRAAQSCSWPRPAACDTDQAFSQERRYKELDTDRETGVIRDRRARLLARTAASPSCSATSPRRLHRENRGRR
jgi:hypothetical protein